MKRPPTELAARLRAGADDVLTPDRAPSIDEVAAAAAIPRATLYYYFAGRDELIDFLLLDKVEEAGTAVRAAADDRQDPSAQLEAVLGAAARTFAAYPTLCTMLLARMAAPSQTEVLSAAVEREVLRPLLDLLEVGVAAGAFELEDPQLSAHGLYGAVSMAALSLFARDGRIDADRLIRVLVPQLVASVRPPQATATGRPMERPSSA